MPNDPMLPETADETLPEAFASAALPPNRSNKRALEPAERIAEVLFGLIMVLTFTGSLSVAEAGREDVVAMLIGALGCNLAWGVIDGLFYLMGCLAEKGRTLATYKAVMGATTVDEARSLIAEALPPLVASLLKPRRARRTARARAAAADTGGPRATRSARLARRMGRIPARVSRDISGRDSLHVLQ